MTIEHGTCDGQHAVLAYVNEDFEPVAKARATMIIASLDDGRKIFFPNDPDFSDAGSRKNGYRDFFDAGVWSEEKHQRNEEGEFGSGAPNRQAQNQAALEALSGSQAKKVKVQPHPVAVDVGGDEWNKHTALRLELEYQTVKPRLEALLQGDKIAVPPVLNRKGEEIESDDPNYEQLKKEQEAFAKWKTGKGTPDDVVKLAEDLMEKDPNKLPEGAPLYNAKEGKFIGPDHKDYAETKKATEEYMKQVNEAKKGANPDYPPGADEYGKVYSLKGDLLSPGDPGYGEALKQAKADEAGETLESIKKKLSKTQAEYEAEVVAEEKGEYEGPPEPKSWEMLNDDKQEEIKNEFMDKGVADYIESEQQQWYDNGGALASAKYELANGDPTEWITETLNDTYQDDGSEFPFKLADIAAAISLKYEDNNGDGSDDVEITIDDAVLNQSVPVGMDPEEAKNKEDIAGLLTETHKDELITELTKAFDKQADKNSSNQEPPEYVGESAKEYAEEDWDNNWSEKQKFNWAKVNTSVIDDLQTEYDLAYAEWSGEALPGDGTTAPPAEDLSGKKLPQPNKFDPLNLTSGEDYKRTQKIAREVSIARAVEVISERGVMPADGQLKAEIRRIDSRLWQQWKDSSTSEDGQLLQVAVADELGGRLNPETGRGGAVKLNKEEQRQRADRTFKTIGGYEGIKAYVRAKWETTQMLLDKAGMHDLQLYRGINLDDKKYNNAMSESTSEGEGGSHIKLPTLNVVRNGAASTSFNPNIANGWSSDANRVVLRAYVPRTAAISVPAYGINVQSEQEVVIAGTAWKKWDAWAKAAPKFSEVPMDDADDKDKKAA